ncbi:C39 family peptidase [Paenibacillus sp. 481]|nr:C39 family peptidase [Paenibacillus sp. 481]
MLLLLLSLAVLFVSATPLGAVASERTANGQNVTVNKVVQTTATVTANVTATALDQTANFKGITAPIGVNVRAGVTLQSRLLYTIAGNTEVFFDGWERGDTLRDYWTGQNDNRWFYFYKNNEKHYVASAFIKGDPTTTPGNKLPVPNVKQKMSNWCWAGVAVSVLQHYGKTVTQEQFVRFTKGSLVNAPATDREILRGLQNYGVTGSIFYNLPTLQWVKAEIDAGKPMITFIRWTNGAAIGHFFVLDGHHVGTNAAQYVSYMDPWYGDHYSRTFDSFKQNNRFVWRGTTSTSK